MFWHRCIRPIAAGLLLSSAFLGEASADVTLKSAILKVDRDRALPLSRLDLPIDDDGFQGGRLATDDNQTTGRFLKQSYETIEVTTKPDELIATLDQLKADGVAAIITVAGREDLLAIADHLDGSGLIVLNASAKDDSLRNDQCRANVLHVAPSAAQLADGLAQYMVWKKWNRWFLIHGSHEEDRIKAETTRRAARKFGAKIVEEREFEDTGGARRSDSGHVLVQKQIPVFTQRAEDHDIVVAVDESEVFGNYLPYRTWDARPVVGDAGLRPLSWHPANEAWGATQFQRRFERIANRRMTEIDYQVWMAIRTLGEAVTRTNTADPVALMDYIRSEAFELAAFKGQKLTFRPWNNQLRQGVLLADEKLIVTVSPQPEFLHRVTRLDTLGYDEPDSTCNFNE